LSALLVAATAVAVTACGSQGNQLAEDDPNYRGATLFEAHCSGCHTMTVAGTEGSAVKIGSSEYKDGPNFNQRKESVEDVIYAIQNGGFSSGPMPQNILTGEDAQAVAEFIAEYSGREAARPPDPQGGNPPTPPGAEPPEDTQ
jgi:mono/diheme cytochrome c family protein